MATQETQLLDEIIVKSRRKMISLGGAALAGLAFTSTAKAQAPALTDADYLNFALNLEYLEGQFYTLATQGKTIDQIGIGIGAGTSATGGGTVTTKGGNNYASCLVPFVNPLVKAYAMETATEEGNHVKFLRSALAAGAVAQPNLDLFNSFNGLITALGIPGLTTFDPFADDASFLLGAYIFEDVGVTAYTGAAAALTVPGNLDAAAGIQGVEAYHAGLIRTTIYGLDQNPAGNMVKSVGLVPMNGLSAVASAISVVRAKLDGTAPSATRMQADDIGIASGSNLQQVMLNGTTNVPASSITNASTTGSINLATSPSTTAGSLVFSRTAAQVLNIVYASPTGKPGGFFPNGLNGNVK
ncbi:MAG: ferritin-like domain-containing protein [Granulicella sp.]